LIISAGEAFEEVPITVKSFLYLSLYRIYVLQLATLVISPAVYANMGVVIIPGVGSSGFSDVNNFANHVTIRVSNLIKKCS